MQKDDFHGKGPKLQAFKHCSAGNQIKPTLAVPQRTKLSS